MSPLYYMKIVTAFVFIIALMYFISWLARRYGGKQMDIARFHNNSDSKMKIIDSIQLDYKRRLVVVDYNGKGYMMMLSPTAETFVASDIELEKQG